MGKDRVDRFLGWLYRVMKDRRVFIRFKDIEDPEEQARYEHYDVDKSGLSIYLITVDPQGPVLPAIIHEGLHIKYPDKDEDTIMELTFSVCNALTMRQWRNLLIRLANNIQDLS